MYDRLRALGDRQLLQRLLSMAQRERSATAALVAHLAELERRGLHRDQGYSSLFDYCVHVLQLSEAAAYTRIVAARLVLRHPVVLGYLQRGELHLSALKMLAPKLTDDNHRQLLSDASGKSKGALQALLAERFPVADVATVVRRLPKPQSAAAQSLSLLPLQPAPEASARPPAATPRPCAGPAPRAELAPLSAQRFKVQFTASQALYDKLQTARQLTGHRHPDGDVAAVIEQALQLLIDQQMKRQFAQTSRPRRTAAADKPGSRTIPAQVRRAVAQRDAMRCTFIADDGHRCQATQRLQYHHERALARGGEASIDNIRLLCQPHNQLMAERDFGPLFMQRARDHQRQPTGRES